MNHQIALIVVLSWMTSTAIAADKYTVQREASAHPSEVHESIQKLLSKESVRVIDANGKTIAEFWFRKELPGKATSEQIKNGITLQEVIETCVMGVVRFPQPFVDYRKQEIETGVYTLRLAYQPDNGDHKDSAPHTEFALICPIGKDQSPEEMEPKSLYKLSFPSTGGEHPGVMLLYPGERKVKNPSVSDRGSGVWTLNSSLTVVSPEGQTEIAFAITIAGHSKLR